MRRLGELLAGLSICGLWCVTGNADDWPQWLGPNGDSVWRETGIVETFPAGGLKVKWRRPVSGGYSGPTVAGGRVYVTDYVIESGQVKNGPSMRVKLEGQERVLCLDANNGSLVWEYQVSCPYHLSYPKGPRAAATVSGDKVYALGAMGNLVCLNASSGEPLWSKDFKKDYGAKTPIWGFSGHPLVDGDKLICLVGGAGSVAVAFNKDTGQEVWRALSAKEPGYCSPLIVDAGGTRQLILWHSEAINGLDPETGKVYWSVELQPSYGMSIATPRKQGDHLFASGVGNTGVLLKLDPDEPQAEVVWRGDARTAVYCANSTPFIDGDTIFGVCKDGELRGVELRTGKRLWETYAATTGQRRGSYGTAFIVKHEDRYFLFNDQGDLIVARLDSQGYQELGRFHVLDPTNEALGRTVVWTHPAFANQAMYARNDKEIVCVSLAAD